MSARRVAEIMRMATEAQQRGWLSEEDFWEISHRSAHGEFTTEELLCPPLSPEQFAELTTSRSLPETLATPPITHDLETPNPFSSDSMIESLTATPSTPLTPPQPRDPSGFQTLHDISVTDSYELRKPLGRGGMGEVYEAYDPKSGRTVALKTLRPENIHRPEYVQRFLREARISAQLEHPCLIPVYDMGSLSDGRPFYTMRVVRHRSLREVLPISEGGWNLKRCIAALVRVCRGLAYAHARGVIHRDLKPENILLGDYDEVYISDWGIAKVIDAEEPQNALSEINTDFTRRDISLSMPTIGSPGYMSPEQAMGKPLDSRSDLFSLGVILYEILTGKRPFQGATKLATLILTQEAKPTPPRELFSGCPLIVEELCLQLLAKLPDNRPDNAESVAQTLDAFLEGSQEQERRHVAASKLVEQARQAMLSYQQFSQARQRNQEKAHRLLKEAKPWDPYEKKKPGWELEDEARMIAADQARALAEAIELYSRALGHEPQNNDARRGLAELYWERAERALIERDEPNRILAESMVLEYDDGRYRTLLASEATLTMATSPPGADVIAHRYTERGRLEVLTEGLLLGRTPLARASMPHGAYLLRVRHPSTVDARYPLFLRRGTQHQAQLRLYTKEQLDDRFAFIPQGSSRIGGDLGAHNPSPEQEIFLGDFAISRFPVTFREYMAFLDDLCSHNPSDAFRRLPRHTVDEKEEPLAARNDAGRFIPLYRNLLRDTGRLFCQPTQVGELPVVGVSWFDAVAYCKWRSQKDGISYQLPTEQQWEKAARGVDGRIFPWGNHFDPSFCKMKASRPGIAQPEPIGAFPLDESPYMVRDMAGGVLELTADIIGVLEVPESMAAQETSKGAAENTMNQRVGKGGAWFLGEPHCHAASRYLLSASTRTAFIGFRLVRPLS